MIKFTKRAFAFAAALIIVLSSSVVFAERTTTPASDQGTVTIEQPASSQTETPSADSAQTAPAVNIPTAVPVVQEQNVVETGQNQKELEKKYASKGFVILWFFLGVIINAVVSFMVANRFYKLARKENHIAAEVRALRRDLEDKFVKSVDDVSEMEIDITNTNENYSAEGSVEEVATSSFSKESEDIFRQWETKMARRAARVVEAPAPEAEAEDLFDEPKRVKKYQPLRDRSENESTQVQGGIKDKAKEFIGNIFPFKEQ